MQEAKNFGRVHLHSSQEPMQVAELETSQSALKSRPLDDAERLITQKQNHDPLRAQLALIHR
jgi:hypothetical protein